MAEAEAATQKNSSKGTIITIVIVVLVALLEGAIFFVAIKWFGGGAQPVYGEEQGFLEEQVVAQVSTAEVMLLEGFRVPNNKDGRMTIYDFDITVVVPNDDEARFAEVQQALGDRINEISDRVAQIIRSASPRSLNEDDFRTLRLQIERAVEEILGDPDAVQRVLIPRCVPLPAA